MVRNLILNANYKNYIRVSLLFLNMVSSPTVKAEDITIGYVPVTVTITSTPKITVEKPGGGWYDTLIMENKAGGDVKKYSINAPVKVTLRGSNKFNVSLLEPFQLLSVDHPGQSFNFERVEFGENMQSLMLLSQDPLTFINHMVNDGVYSGVYTLSISAIQPDIDLHEVTGKYTGKIVLLFETSI